MKTELESQDIEAIAARVVEMIKPLLSTTKATEDVIYTPETLAEYLHVDISWVYKQVSLKTIPYFKSGKYTRFKKSAIDKWTDNKAIKAIPQNTLRVVK